MGITVNQYENTATGEVEDYLEEGTDEHARDRLGMSGTLDTTGVGPGAFEDLRNVTDTFDLADARVADALDASGVDPVDNRLIETGEDGEVTNADLAERLRNPEVDESLRKNPIEGDPDDAQEQVDQAEEERQRAEDEAEARRQDEARIIDEQRKQAIEADALTDAQRQDQGIQADGTKSVDADPTAEHLVEGSPAETQSQADGDQGAEGTKSTDEVLDGTVPEIEEYVQEHPEQAQEILDAEEEKSDSPRKGVIEAAEKAALYDPSDNNVKDTKAYFETVDDDEVLRVQVKESEGQNRPGIVNWTRPTA